MSKTVNDLTFAPRYEGKIFYNGIHPIFPEDRRFTYLDQPSKTVAEIYYQPEGWTRDERQYVLDYIAYYINAPVWALPEEIKQKSFELTSKEDADKFLCELLDRGIDIF